METSLYPQVDGIFGRTEINDARIDFNQTFGDVTDYRFFLDLNEGKGNISLFVSKQEARFFAQSILLMLDSD